MKFIIDENIPKQIAEALNILDKDNEVLSVEEAFDLGKSDTELIPLLGKSKAFYITHDLKQKSRSKECQLYFDHNVSTYIISFPSGAKHWDKVIKIFNDWSDIIKVARKNSKHTFVYRIKMRGKIEFMFGTDNKY